MSAPHAPGEVLKNEYGDFGEMKPVYHYTELLVELIAHNNASGSAARATVESTLKEFAPDALVVLANLTGKTATYRMIDLLPHGFDAKQLRAAR